jgi:hypothetical protein
MERAAREDGTKPEEAAAKASARVVRHLPPTELPMAWVRLGSVHLHEIADHLGGLAQRHADAEREEWAGSHERHAGETAEKWRERMAGDLQWTLERARPTCSVHLENGESLSGEDLRAILDQAAPSEVTAIHLHAKGPHSDVEVSLPLDGPEGEVKIKAENRHELDAETGFFRRFVDRRRTWLRYLTMGYPIGFVAWILVPAVALTVAIFRLAGWTLSTAGATLTGLYLVIIVGVLAFFVARRTTRALVPQVQIETLGPHQELRRQAEALVVGILASAAIAAVVVLWPWLTTGK